MADDGDSKPTVDEIVAGIEIDSLAKIKGMRKRGRPSKPFIPMPYQTLSDGQWRKPPQDINHVVDDFTGKLLHHDDGLIGKPEGPQPTPRELDQAKREKDRAEIEQAVKREQALVAIRKQTMPERFVLRRNIDMTVVSAPKAVRSEPQPTAKVAPGKTPHRKHKPVAPRKK